MTKINVFRITYFFGAIFYYVFRARLRGNRTKKKYFNCTKKCRLNITHHVQRKRKLENYFIIYLRIPPKGAFFSPRTD